MRPRIGVISCPATESHYHLSQNIVGSDYLLSIIAAGGIPIILPSFEEGTLLEEYLDFCGGFLFCGGGDLNPITYKQTPDFHLQPTDIRYDTYQISLLTHLHSRRKPYLAICRGIQVMNVALGGTLYQDISLQPGKCFQHMQPSLNRWEVSHTVHTQNATILHKLLGSVLPVNSYHHQSVHALGENLRISATAPDGTIEAIETTDHPFQIGVQWHPENFIHTSKCMLPLFHQLIVESAKG